MQTSAFRASVSRLRWSRFAQERLLGIALVAPALALIFGLVLYPFAYSVLLSFQSYDLQRGLTGWIGLASYERIIISVDYQSALWASVIWTVGSISGQVVAGLAIAHLLNMPLRGQGLARSLIILPWAVSGLVVAFIWRWLLNDVYGLVNYALVSAHVIQQPITFFGTPTMAMSALVVVNIWRGIPFMALVFLGGLQTIPHERYEAAKVDGANWWQEFVHITLPGLRHVIIVVVVLRTIWVFNWFDLPWLLTGGGPLKSTQTLPLLAYTTAFRASQFSQAAAISVTMFLVLLLFVIVFFRVVREEEGE